jgi:hypothetical protein
LTPTILTAGLSECELDEQATVLDLGPHALQHASQSLVQALLGRFADAILDDVQRFGLEVETLVEGPSPAVRTPPRKERSGFPVLALPADSLDLVTFVR